LEDTKQTKTADAAKPAATTPTPFGDVKASAQTETTVKVTEHGDTLEFERPSPFGSYKWKAKKSELKASEREAWERSKKQSADPGPKE
jgi:hypothetical protein